MSMLMSTSHADLDLPRVSSSARPVAGNQTLAETRTKMRQFVGETFFTILVRQMEKGLNQHNPLSGGRGEEVFRKEMNQLMVRRMAAASHFPMADAAADQILKNTPHSRICSPERAEQVAERNNGGRA